MKKVLITLILFSVALVACRKVIDLDLKESDPFVVLKGEVNAGDSVHTLNITKSVPFDEDNVFPGVTGAVVILTDDQGTTETLLDMGDGNYETINFPAFEGRTYTFSVTLEGTTYESTTTIPVQTPLTDVEFIPTSFFGDTGFVLVPKFLDPAGIENSYLFYYFNKNDEDENSGYIYTNDDFADGMVNEQPFFGNYSPDSGDTVITYMWGIDQSVYKYYFSFDQNTSPNSGAPANPVSNWSNGALGYSTAQNFQAIEVVTP